MRAKEEILVLRRDFLNRCGELEVSPENMAEAGKLLLACACLEWVLEVRDYDNEGNFFALLKEQLVKLEQVEKRRPAEGRYVLVPNFVNVYEQRLHLIEELLRLARLGQRHQQNLFARELGEFLFQNLKGVDEWLKRNGVTVIEYPTG